MSKLKELEKRLANEPENLGLRVMVAGAMREAGRQAEAVELYRSVAIAYRDQGRSQQAIAVCRSILEIAPEDGRCHALLAALVAGHKARTARETSPFGEGVLEVNTPPPPRDKPPSIPPLVNARGVPHVVHADETPLPVPMPYHVADPTTRNLQRLSASDLMPTPDPDDLPMVEDAKTRPGSESGSRAVTGLSNAARRISNALINTPRPPSADLSAELDTRQRPKIETGELARIAQPPPTVPIERFDDLDDDAVTGSPPTRVAVEPDDDGVPTLPEDDPDEVTRPRDTALDLLIRTEAQGPFGTAFFQPLPAAHREAVLARFHHKLVRRGTMVIRQGEVGHALVVVVKGQLEVTGVGIVATGEFVGEGSLLARTASPVQVVAATDCELLLLPPRDFYEIAGAFPALWAELKDVAERRKRRR